jgi:hypothetical protein
VIFVHRYERKNTQNNRIEKDDGLNSLKSGNAIVIA